MPPNDCWTKVSAIESENRFNSKLAKVQRKLEHKTSNEFGDGAQINLFETLRDEFADDKITPIKKGVAGADVRHEVCHNGVVCGSILYDSKARQAWRNDYVTKLRDDQIADDANHA